MVLRRMALITPSGPRRLVLTLDRYSKADTHLRTPSHTHTIAHPQAWHIHARVFISLCACRYHMYHMMMTAESWCARPHTQVAPYEDVTDFSQVCWVCEDDLWVCSAQLLSHAAQRMPTHTCTRPLRHHLTDLVFSSTSCLLPHLLPPSHPQPAAPPSSCHPPSHLRDPPSTRLIKKPRSRLVGKKKCRRRWPRQRRPTRATRTSRRCVCFMSRRRWVDAPPWAPHPLWFTRTDFSAGSV